MSYGLKPDIEKRTVNDSSAGLSQGACVGGFRGGADTDNFLEYKFYNQIFE